MRILLLGEYSKLHNSLKSGLLELGHEVDLAGTGDGFKNFPVDFSYAPKLTSQHGFFHFIKRVCYRLFKLDLTKTESGIRFFFLLKHLKNYDHLQLINSDAIRSHPKWNLFLLKRLFKQNKKISLLVCGDETPITDYLLQNKLKYSVLTPYLENPILKNDFYDVLKYSHDNYRKVFDFINEKTSVLITSDMDYKIPMDALGYKNHFIPNPVEQTTVPDIPAPVKNQINIFLGINRLSYHKKGIHFFEEALQVIQKKYPHQALIQIVENLPYQAYIEAYQKANIVLDMVYAYDQGYNALEAMRHGKVVFTGAEKEFLDFYNLEEDKICINALPDVKVLVEKLSELIENPSKINEIGKNAQHFIREKHHAVEIAKKYIMAWES